MKYLILVMVLLASSIALAEIEPNQGRYVLVRQNDSESFLLDSKTGEVWHLSIDKDSAHSLTSIAFNCFTEKGETVFAYNPECSKKSISLFRGYKKE